MTTNHLKLCRSGIQRQCCVCVSVCCESGLYVFCMYGVKHIEHPHNFKWNARSRSELETKRITPSEQIKATFPHFCDQLEIYSGKAIITLTEAIVCLWAQQLYDFFAADRTQFAVHLGGRLTIPTIHSFIQPNITTLHLCVYFLSPHPNLLRESHLNATHQRQPRRERRPGPQQ